MIKHLPFDEPNRLPSPPGFYYESSQEEKEVNLRDYWRVIQKRRWTIIAFFFIVLITTAVATFTMKPIYRATVTLQINKENPQIVDFKEIFAVNTMDLDYYQTQYKILESRSLAKRVIQPLKLSEHPEFLKKPETPFQRWKADLLQSVTALFSSSPSNTGPSEAEKDTILINRFLKKLKVEPIRNSRLVKIHFDSNFPELSERVADELAAAYLQQTLEARFNATEQARDWLTKQLEDLKAKVERAEEDLQAFGSKHDIISLEEKENVTIQRLNELNEVLTKAETERMGKEALYKQTKDRHFDSLPSILENKLIMDLKQAFIQLEAQYMKLSETFKPDYPEMVRLKTQIETIQKRLNNETEKIIASIKNDYESSLRREGLLRQSFEQQKVRVMTMKEKAIQHNILKREADTNKELYKGLLQRMKEAGVSAGIMASNIQVVDKAGLPTKPHKPISHPERNLEIGRRPGRYDEIIKMGCFGQVTAMSLTGEFGPKVRQWAEKLLKSWLVHFIASDAHSPNGRPPILSAAVKAAAKIVGKKEAEKMVTEYPKAILEGRRPNIPDPLPI